MTTQQYFGQRPKEVLRYIEENKDQLDPLVVGTCLKDHRLAAVYRLPDGYWLWQRGERWPKGQVQQEAMRMAVMEYETAAEHGDTDEAAAIWDRLTTGDVGNARADFPPRVWPLGDTIVTYRSIEELRAAPPSGIGALTSCQKCGHKFVVDTPVLAYAASQAIATRARRPVVVHLARVLLPGNPEYADAGGPTMGSDPPWRTTPWLIV